MSIGYALIVIFVLYLIDKHNRWRQAAMIVGGLIILGALGIGGVYGWTKYGEYKTAKQQAVQQAAFIKRLQDCLTRNSGAGPRDIFDDVSTQEACEKDPETEPPCWSKPNDKGGLQLDLNNEFDLNGKRIPPDPKGTCYPIIDAKAPDCKNGLVPGCIDRSSEPWKKYQKAGK
jgi:hypothetical protein